MDNKQNTKRPSRFLQHRHKRLKAIEEYIASGIYPTRQKLADLLEVPPEIIKKDIQSLKELGQPIEHCLKRGGYHHTKEFTGLLAMHHVSIEEIFSLHIVESAFASLGEIPYAKDTISTVQKIMGGLSTDVDYPDWKNLVSFHTSGVCLFDPEIFRGLYEAGSERYRVTVLYRKPGKDNEYELRTLDIHHIARIDTEYFVFAFDVGSGKMRTFIPARMKDVKTTGEKFRRKKFDIYERLKYSFQVFDGEHVRDLLIEFEADVADYIREKRWGGQVGLRDLPDGGVELHLRLSSLFELKRFMMKWPGKAAPTNCVELEEMLIQSFREGFEYLEKRRAQRLAAEAKSAAATAPAEAPTPVATAKVAPDMQLENVIALVAKLTPEQKEQLRIHAGL